MHLVNLIEQLHCKYYPPNGKHETWIFVLHDRAGIKPARPVFGAETRR